MVLDVDPEVIVQAVDAGGEKRDLHLGRTGITLRPLIFGDDLGLLQNFLRGRAGRDAQCAACTTTRHATALSACNSHWLCSKISRKTAILTRKVLRIQPRYCAVAGRRSIGP